MCDNFAVNQSEFEAIFASNLATFNIWDTDNNGKGFEIRVLIRID